jgi:hypothetical protein
MTITIDLRERDRADLLVHLARIGFRGAPESYLQQQLQSTVARHLRDTRAWVRAQVSVAVVQDALDSASPVDRDAALALLKLQERDGQFEPVPEGERP